jgi:polysaccharide biosynthesis transport protein
MAESERAGLTNPRTYLRGIRRRIGLVALCVLMTPAAVLAVALASEKKYTASASLLFRDAGFDQQLFGAPLFIPGDAERRAATNEKLVSLGVVADRTARRVGGGLTGGEVSSKVETKAEGKSDILSVVATDADPRRAAGLANAFAREYIAVRRKADREKVRQARELVSRSVERLSPSERKSQRGRLLQEREQQLETIGALQTGNAELAQRASIPTAPSSPKPVRDAALAAGLGLVLGIGLALLFERLDRRMRDPKEVEAAFDRPILATIPETRALAQGPYVTDLHSGEGEAFRMLNASLRYFNIDREVRTVLVTSPAPGDGKTTVAWNLASAAASPENRVLLIEADLRHPGMASFIGAAPPNGLSSVLSGQAELHEAVQQVPVPEQQNGALRRTVDVLFAGPLPPNPAELLESDRMRDLLETAQRTYDLVIVDTPPTSVVSDAIPLLNQVGGVIVVGRLGKSTRDSVARLNEQLQNLRAPTLGVVVNSIHQEHDAYGYGYGYGGRDEAATTAK